MCDLCGQEHPIEPLSLEDYVKHRCMELGVNESITPHVLDELRRRQLVEAKALATHKTGGVGAATKRAAVKAAQATPKFRSSQRGYRREAGLKIKMLISSFAEHLSGLVKNYVAGELSASRLQTRTSIAFKEAIDQAFKLGAKAVGYVSPTGEVQEPTANEKKWIESYVKEELGYFQRFLRDVRNGQSEKRNNERVGRYASALNSVYEAGRILSAGPHVLVDWMLESAAPCPDCKLLAAHNPYTVDTLPTTPKAGATRCLWRCYCTLKISQATPARVAQVRKAHKSKAWLLRKIKEQQKARRTKRTKQ